MQKKEHTFITSLSSDQKAKLKALAHHLKPLIQIGNNGFSDNVKKEIHLALEKHELIKIQLPGDSTASTKEDMQNQLTAVLPAHSHCVARIGRAVIVYLEKLPAEQTVKLK